MEVITNSEKETIELGMKIAPKLEKGMVIVLSGDLGSGKTKLTEGDLRKAFDFYVEDLDYEVIDFKYLDGIHKVGNHFDQDTPHYEGVQLEVIKKEKEKILNR